jgi:glycosyltransferase involved in cell wall biosynthesis
METRPAVSVVIPLYNARSWIGETLESVRRQTYPFDNIELIVVDDGSRDDSVVVARRFLAERSVPGVVSSQQNAGVSAARNRGWKLATAQWIQFLDADDLLAPAKIELQMAFAGQQADDVAVIYSPWKLLQSFDGDWRPSGQFVDHDVDDGDTVVQILKDGRFGYVGPTLIRRSFLERVGGFDESLNLGEDFDLMLRIAMSGGRFRKLRSDEAMFLQRETPGSLWQRARGNAASIARLARVSRKAEMFLRRQSASGLPAEARGALAARYSHGLDLLLERDLDTFWETNEWIRGLGVDHPPPGTPRLKLVSDIIGYETAQRVRRWYLKAKRWVQPQ